MKKSGVNGLAGMMTMYREESMVWVEEKVREQERVRRLGGGDGDETEEEVEMGILGNGKGTRTYGLA